MKIIADLAFKVYEQMISHVQSAFQAFSGISPNLYIILLYVVLVIMIKSFYYSVYLFFLKMGLFVD